MRRSKPAARGSGFHPASRRQRPAVPARVALIAGESFRDTASTWMQFYFVTRNRLNASKCLRAASAASTSIAR